MEILSFYYAPCSYVENLRKESVLKSSKSQSKLNFRKHRLWCTKIDSRCGSLKLCNLDRLRLRNIRQGLRNVESKVLTGTYNGYVIATKVVIPDLPDESNCESGAPVSSCFWEWKPKFNVHYEKAGCENLSSPPVLFLPGFGVGSFHYEKQLKDLGRDFRVWAIDFLGQGKSLPLEDPTTRSNEGDTPERKDYAWGDLVYSIDLWKDQVRYFIDQVIGEPVYVVGNSLGGFVALYFAACNPHLVKGVTLLNATPFWGFLPNPIRSPRLAKLFPWTGTFPLPTSVRKLTEFIWQKISDPGSIAEILKQVYADHSTKVDKVCCCIIASIMFAPRGQLSFREALTRCQMNNCTNVPLVWKRRPLGETCLGLQVKRQVPEAPYYEISPAGHCPHDEVPEGGSRKHRDQGSVALPLLGMENVSRIALPGLGICERWIQKSSEVNFFGSRFSVWNRIRSYMSSHSGKSDIKS
ncbi:hypothetical protein I3760_11G024900 [Carya illinoinensis]|nr:hypothetical protein I3760_11G024900 [Carya illinoinensis]